MLFKRKNNLTVFKLYSIGMDQTGVNRPHLVEALLKLFDNTFEELPKGFVIHGPYGISKGQNVGIRAFKNKLESKGHEKYDALHGETESRLGFEAHLRARMGDETYSELTIWFDPNHFSASLTDVAAEFLHCFPISTGFEIDINPSKQTVSEHKIKRSLFGNISVEVSYDTKQWIPTFRQGTYRKLFRKNLLSDLQLQKALKHNPAIRYHKRGNLNYVEIAS